MCRRISRSTGAARSSTRPSETRYSTEKIGITPGNAHRVYFPKIAERSGTDPSKIVWVNMDGAAMAAQLIARNIDAQKHNLANLRDSVSAEYVPNTMPQ